MKTTLLFALLTTVFAVPRAAAMSELETLRAQCAAQDQKIRQLEAQLGKSSSATSQSSGAAGSYVVRSGDSLERIARRNSCSLASLMKANGLKSSSVIHPGQKLKLPGSSASASVAATSSPKSTVAQAPSSLSGKTHTIRPGDTFASISRQYKVSVNSLISANPSVKPTALQPGQKIQLSGNPAAMASSKPATPSRTLTASMTPSTRPASSTPVSATRSNSSSIPVSAPLPSNEVVSTPATSNVSSPPAEPAPEAAATPAPSNTEKKIHSVTIEGEMTYGEFAAKHGTDTSRLNDLNGLDLTTATVLAKGSELYVPAQP